jgi:hypothetical protein
VVQPAQREDEVTFNSHLAVDNATVLTIGQTMSAERPVALTFASAVEPVAA